MVLCQGVPHTHSCCVAAYEKVPIKITMPDGSVKEGVAFQTSPMDIANSIAKSLAKSAIVAAVKYSERLGEVVDVADPEEEEEGDHHHGSSGEYILWDMSRPLEGSCELLFKKYDDPEGQEVFKHSSAHILGAALESEFGVKLCIGPPTQEGFYYDAYMGEEAIKEEADFKKIEKSAQAVIKKNHTFDRVTLTKDEALELFGVRGP